MQAMQEMLSYSRTSYAMSLVGKTVTASRYTVSGELDTTTGKKTIRYQDPTEKEYKELSKKGIEIVREKYNLDYNEEIALKQIDAMKTELVNIYRFKQSSGNDRFDLAPSVANKLNDDRAYVFVMACHFLQYLRREPLITRKPIENFEDFFEFKRPKATHSYFN
jgi:flagellar hook assembly protein FlgD